jgi:hypothetical protein
VRWGVLRNDMAPPGSGYGVNEEKTSSGAGLFTRVGYHNGGVLSRDIVSTCLAQDFFNWIIDSMDHLRALAGSFMNKSMG